MYNDPQQFVLSGLIRLPLGPRPTLSKNQAKDVADLDLKKLCIESLPLIVFNTVVSCCNACPHRKELPNP